MEIAWIIASALISGVLVYLYLQRQHKSSSESTALRTQQLQSELEVQRMARQKAEEDLRLLADKREVQQRELVELTAKFSRMEAEKQNLEERIQRDLSEAEKREEEMRNRFEVLANEILERKSEKFTHQNKEQLGELLLPFRERILEFQKRVENNELQGEKRNAALVEQIKSLKELNQQITQEAKSLTKALRGDSKAQGNWGELQLEQILSRAGLEKDIHYFKEKNFKNEEGQNQRLDYIINLPDGKHLILDSKVSLTAYSRYFEAEEEGEQARALKEHVNSIHAHIKGLGERNYQNLYGINPPDYVMMFIANEPALTIALKEDPQLYEKALDRNIALVSTATLLATLRTVAYIWKQDQQNKNADEIARQAAALYDKFVNFSEDLIKLGNQMGTATKTYKDAMNKLSEGRGNLIRSSEKIRKLGVNPNKSLNPKLLDRAGEEEDNEAQ